MVFKDFSICFHLVSIIGPWGRLKSLTVILCILLKVSFIHSFIDQLTSQHPYMETFIGKPHVYTIDVNNLDLVEATIKEIISLEVRQFSAEQAFELHSFTETKPLLSNRPKTCCWLSLYALPLMLFVCLFVYFFKLKPFLPYEWTPGGMLERLNAFVEKMVSSLGGNKIPM